MQIQLKPWRDVKHLWHWKISWHSAVWPRPHPYKYSQVNWKYILDVNFGIWNTERLHAFALMSLTLDINMKHDHIICIATQMFHHMHVALSMNNFHPHVWNICYLRWNNIYLSELAVTCVRHYMESHRIRYWNSIASDIELPSHQVLAFHELRY